MGIVLVLIGYLVGLCAASNIVLPLLWAWPKARRLKREDRLRKPIPLARFVVPPGIWLLALAASYWLVYAVFAAANSYLFGTLIGTFQVGKLVFAPNASMSEDFESAYEPYLRKTAATVGAP
jgi:hypothetical protein